ncbi:PREDICTED: protein lingerer-like [Chrysochloris asiatica]|uniref:Protein lingerer-like n=1 Tax=Chrysochloris asiatica TaxID=185453 RepID=A0A9B0U0A6_CHRAS|nr:PREDICTED: protein lingerer-like [Chrysochloris asiatica]
MEAGADAGPSGAVGQASAGPGVAGALDASGRAGGGEGAAAAALLIGRRAREPDFTRPEPRRVWLGSALGGEGVRAHSRPKPHAGRREALDRTRLGGGARGGGPAREGARGTVTSALGWAAGRREEDEGGGGREGKMVVAVR